MQAMRRIILTSRRSICSSIRSVNETTQTNSFARQFTTTTKKEIEGTVTISDAQLRKVFLASAAPMLGFGFMDNFVMIQAGGAIDATLGVRLGLATMTAAALGQVVSDVSGVLFGGVVERMLTKIGIHAPNLTPAQRRLARCRNASTGGAVIGVTIGCLLGAFPLLLGDMDAGEKKRRMDEMKDTLDAMIHSTINDNINKDNAGNVIGAKHVAIHFCRDHDRRLCLAELNSTCFSPQSASIAIQCLEKRRTLRVDSSDNEKPAILCTLCCYKNISNRHFLNLLTFPFSAIGAPVYSEEQQRVVAILEFVGKRVEDRSDSSTTLSFTPEDERLVRMLTQHMGILIAKMY